VDRGLTAPQRVQVADQLGGRRAGLARQHPEGKRLRPDGVLGGEVELGPVAGRDRGGLLHLGGSDQLAEHPGGPPLGERDALAQPERGGLVGDPEGEQLGH
jgi:hypothetical protein